MKKDTTQKPKDKFTEREIDIIGVATGIIMVLISIIGGFILYLK